MRNQTTSFQNLAAQFFLGSIALSLVTLAFFRLGVDLASTAYLIVIVLFSPMGSFTASALPAMMSVAGLAYFFAPPIFDSRMVNSQHAARLQAGGVVIQLGGRQQSHHLKRDEQGE